MRAKSVAMGGALLLGGVMLFSASRPALAFDGAAIAAAIAAAQAALAGIMQNLLNVNIGNIGATIQVETQREIAAERQIAQGRVAAETALYMEEARAEAAERYELSPRACYDTAAGMAAAAGVGEAREAVAGMMRDLTTRGINVPSTSAAVTAIFRDHEQFCSPESARLGRCAAPASPELQNADIRVDALLARTFLTPEQQDAAQKLCRNITAPIPVQNLPAGIEKTPAGRQFVAAQLVQQARVSAAQNACLSAVAKRVVVSGLGEGSTTQADVSPMQLMESTVNSRFASPEWNKMIATSLNENLLRELNKQQAFGLWMQFQQFQQFERIESMLAADLAVTIERDAERLRATREAAVRSVAPRS